MVAMRKLLALCFAAFFAASAQAQVGLTGYPPTGQLPGTATNDNAAAGNVGQIISASTSESGDGAGTTRTVTITIASPAVVTWPVTLPYGFSGTGCAAVTFSTTGALPTGITAGTVYYVISSSVSGNTFQIATSVDNAIAGTAVNTSGTQSGTHSAIARASLTSNAQQNVAGISLSAGDWDVNADIAFLSAASTSISLVSGSIATVSATYQSSPGQVAQIQTAAQVPGVANNILHIGPRRFSLSATTTLYLVTLPTFTVSTLEGWGGIRARRVR